MDEFGLAAHGARPETRISNSAPANEASISSNLAYLLLGEITNKGLRFLALIVIARALSADDLGVVSLSLATAGLAVAVGSFGLVETGTRAIARAPDDASDIASTIILLRVACITCVAAAVGAVVLLPRSTFGFACLLGMCLALGASPDWVGRSLERMAQVAAAAVAGGLCVFLGSLLVPAPFRIGDHVLAVFVAGEVVAAGVAWTLLRDAAKPLRGVTWSGVAAAKQTSTVAVGTICVYLAFANLDVLILGTAKSAAVAGDYATVYRLFYAGTIPMIYVGYAIFPRMARSCAMGNQAPERLLARAAGLVAVVGCAGAVPMSAWSTEIAGGMFGTRFSASGEELATLLLAVPWFGAGYTVGYGELGRGSSRCFLGGAVTMLAVNVIANVVMIPLYGAEGAALSTLGSCIAGALVWWLTSSIRKSVMFGVLLLAVLVTTMATLVVRL